jgi:HlyD family secretion protein
MKSIVRTVLIIIGVVGVVAALVFLLPQVTQNQTTSIYTTQPAQKSSLTAFVGATGSVRSNQTATLVWQTGGTIDQVLVQKGQQVQAGTELANLLQTSLSQNIILAQADLIAAQKNLDKILNNAETRANAEVALAQAKKAVNDAEKESQSKLYQRAGSNTIDIARANLILAEQNLTQAEDDYNKVAGRSTDDAIYAQVLTMLAKARQERDRAEYNLRYVEGLPSPLDIETIDAKLSQAQAQLQAAKTEWERIKDGPDSKDIASAQARLAAAQATLNLAQLTAPFNATVTDVTIKPGDQITAGTRAFRLDDLTRLLVDVQVSEVDINRVQVGQPVTLTFDAIPAKEYSAVVVDIASVGTTTSGAVYFDVTIELVGADNEIKTGMTAAVNIAVTQLENVLVVPNQAVRVINGKRVVYVLQNEIPVPIDITLGASSNTQSEVVAGDLKEGDLIVLNPPTQAFQGGPGSGGGMGGGN